MNEKPGDERRHYSSLTEANEKKKKLKSILFDENKFHWIKWHIGNADHVNVAC